MSNKKLCIYYAVLVLLMMSWTSFSSPNLILRVAYLAAVIFPALRYNLTMLPAAITLFWSISINGYAYSFMPTEQYIYAIFFILLLLMKIRVKDKISIRGGDILWVFLFYTIAVDVLNNLSLTLFNYSFLIMLLMTYFLEENDCSSVKTFEVAFIVLSLVISFYSLTTRNQFAQTTSDMERIGWTDPNYLSNVIAMGVILSFDKISKFTQQNFYVLAISIPCFILGFISMLFLASRGAFLALAIGLSILIIFSRTNKLLKILVPLAFIAFVIYLYNNDYFFILENRIEVDDGTGSDRSNIWENKLLCFSEQGPFRWIFGNGQRGAFYLGSVVGIGFHNDYLAILCGYGIVGLSFFIYMLALPFKLSISKIDAITNVLPYWLLLTVGFLTLEPITAGRFTYFAFYFYILLRAKYYKKII